MKAYFFVFITGLLLTLGGVGGIENSVTNAELTSSLIVACVGLAIVYCSSLMLRNQTGE
jgi:uncharacterized membrane protein